MKLLELTEDKKLTNGSEIYKWVIDHAYDSESDGQVTNDNIWQKIKVFPTGVFVEGSLGIDTDDGEIPFKFTRAGGNFSLLVNTSKMAPKTMKGCPNIVTDNFTIEGDLPSFEGSPKSVGGSYYCLEFTSLKGIEKHVDKIGEALVIRRVKGGLLSVILVKSLGSIEADDPEDEELDTACKIVNKYLGKGRAGVLDAQKELEDYEDLDLSKFAKL